MNAEETLLKYLNNCKISTMDEIKSVLSTQSRMTVFRRLRKLDYISSCSHRGKYYSLKRIAKHGKYGLWIHKSVLFSKHGTLKNTLQILLNQSSKGYTASELNKILKIKVDDALLELSAHGANSVKLKARVPYLCVFENCLHTFRPMSRGVFQNIAKWL